MIAHMASAECSFVAGWAGRCSCLAMDGYRAVRTRAEGSVVRVIQKVARMAPARIVLSSCTFGFWFRIWKARGIPWVAMGKRSSVHIQRIVWALKVRNAAYSGEGSARIHPSGRVAMMASNPRLAIFR